MQTLLILLAVIASLTLVIPLLLTGIGLVGGWLWHHMPGVTPDQRHLYRKKRSRRRSDPRKTYPRWLRGSTHFTRYNETRTRDRTFRVEWHWWFPVIGAGLKHDCDLTLTCMGGLWNVWLTWEGFLEEPGFEERWDTSWRLSWDGRGVGPNLSWRLWSNPDIYHSTTPRWKDGSVYFRQIVLGKPRVDIQVLDRVDGVPVPMPEGTYKANIWVERRTVSYPRWFTHSHLYGNYEIPGGIPFEGKGTAAWNCGTDGLFGGGCDQTTIPKIVGHIVGSVLSDRIKNGGWDDWEWTKPSERPRPVHTPGVPQNSDESHTKRQ